MKPKTRKLIVSIIFASVLVLGITTSIVPPAAAATYVSRGPIDILGDAYFNSDNGVNGGGSGTWADPYIIENWSISAATDHGIYITNTTKYFVIRNCLVENGKTPDKNGVYLNVASYGTISNNSVNKNDNGIFILNSSYENILNNSCDNNFYSGILLNGSHYSNIKNNTCMNAIGSWDNSGVGINTFGGSKLNILDNNTAYNNTYCGIRVYGSAFLKTTVTNNYCYNTWGHNDKAEWDNVATWNGIYLTRAENSLIENNHCDNSSHAGIKLAYSRYDNLVNNICDNNNSGVLIDETQNTFIIIKQSTFTYNTWGIKLDSADDDSNTIDNNTFKFNTTAGLCSYFACTGNTITNNIFENNYRGIHLEAATNNTIYLNQLLTNTDNNGYDTGSNNWDNGSKGNYWSDWQPPTHPDANGNGVVDTARTILGGSNQDDYPLVLSSIIQITSITVSENLIDRDQDYTGSPAILTTTVTARITSTLGRDYITVARIAFRDNENNVVENDSVLSSHVDVDATTIDVSVSFNCPDNLTDNRLGGFDVWVFASSADNSKENWDNGAFVVDDLKIPATLAPDNTEMGYAYGFRIKVSGTMSRYSGAAASIDNSWRRDESAGDNVLGAANAYFDSWIILAESGLDNLYVRIWGHDNALDGWVENDYSVNDNEYYTVYVRFEETFDLVPDGVGGDNAIENRNLHLTFFYPSSTQEFDMTTNPESFIIKHTDLTKVRLTVDDNTYWRTRIPANPGNIVFFVVENMTLTQYRFTLKDFTGDFGISENGFLRLSKYYEDNYMNIHEDYWNAELVVDSFLCYGEEYVVTVANETKERSVSSVAADGTTSKEIQVGLLTPLGEYQSIWDNVAWSAWWENTNMKVSYLDNLTNTENSYLSIYDENGNVAYQYFSTADEWALTWMGGDNSTDYVLELGVIHNTFGSENQTIRIVLAGGITPVLPATGIPGVNQLGSWPAPVGALFSIFATIIVALTFGRKHVGMTVLTIGLVLILFGVIYGMFAVTQAVASAIGFIIFLGITLLIVRKRQQ